MAKNKLSDLNDPLFVALERLNEEGLSPEQITAEVARAKAVSDVGDKVIEVAKIALEGVKLQADYLGGNQAALPAMFDVLKLENHNA